MKTYKNLFEKVCSHENLYSAYLKAREGKNGSEEVLDFTYNLEDELLSLQSDLESGAYRNGKYRHFVIFEPKRRTISALPFRDRVVHHAIYSVLEPIFEKSFIYDSYACRKGKGTHAGVQRLQDFVRRLSSGAYVLKCDISKYFMSVNSVVLKKCIRRKISDERLLFVLDNLIDSQKKGIPIGNLTSQLFANVYLNELDGFVKYDLRVKFYIRYMDDFILLSESKIELRVFKNKIELFLLSIDLFFHPKKVNIFPVKVGIDFLGYRIFSNYKLVRKSTVRRGLKNIKNKINEYGVCRINFEKLIQSINSWEAYLNHANTYSLKKELKQEMKNAI